MPAQPARDPDALVRRSLRVHGVLDLSFAALYAYLGFAVAAGRSAAFNVALAVVVGVLVVAGGSLLAGVRWSRLAAMASSILLLAFCLVVVTLLVASVAYLRGIYGPVGKGAALVSILVAALVIELCGLLPIFQLRLLLRDDIKQYFHSRQ